MCVCALRAYCNENIFVFKAVNDRMEARFEQLIIKMDFKRLRHEAEMNLHDRGVRDTAETMLI